MADITITFSDGATEKIHLESDGEITDGNLVDIALDYTSYTPAEVVDAVVTNND